MTLHTRLTSVALALGLLLAAAVPLAAPAVAQAPPPADGAPSSSPLAPGATGGASEVHSWSLAPAGEVDPSQPGNRPVLSYEVAPGTTLHDQMTLSNYGNVQMTFRVYPTDAYNNADGAFDVLPGTESPTGAGTWITLPQENITLPPGTQATFPIQISVPADATPGDHAAGVLASAAVTGTGADGAVVTVDRRTGTRVYLRVEGDLRPELAVEAVEASYGPTLNPLSGDTEVSYRIVNRGNVRLGGTHRVKVAGPFGLLGRSSPTVTLAELLPGQSVTYNTTVPGVAALGIARAQVELIPTEPSGDAVAGDAVKRSGWGLAVPVSVIAVALVAGLLLYARRAYRRHATSPVAEPVADLPPTSPA